MLFAGVSPHDGTTRRVPIAAPPRGRRCHLAVDGHARAIRERTATDARDRAGDRHRGQAIAIIERSVPDACDRVADRHRGQATAPYSIIIVKVKSSTKRGVSKSILFETGVFLKIQGMSAVLNENSNFDCRTLLARKKNTVYVFRDIPYSCKIAHWGLIPVKSALPRPRGRRRRPRYRCAERARPLLRAF